MDKHWRIYKQEEDSKIRLQSLLSLSTAAETQSRHTKTAKLTKNTESLRVNFQSGTVYAARTHASSWIHKKSLASADRANFSSACV